VLVAAIALPSCAAVAGRPVAVPAAPPEPVSAETLLAGLDARSAAIRTFRALAEMRYVGPRDKLAAKQVVVVERPNRLRIEMMSAFGVSLQIASDGERVCAYHRGEQTYYRGRATTQNLTRFTRLDLGLPDIVDLVTGLPPHGPRIGRPTFAFEPPLALWRVTTALADHGAFTLWFDPEHLLPTRAIEVHPGGKIAYDASFADYRPSAGVEIPRTVRFALPDQETKIELKYSDVSLNVELAPGLFRFDPPPGVKIVDLDELPQVGTADRPRSETPDPGEPLLPGSPETAPVN
jgi:outer membrane lipoprotein-sorting protein